MILTFYTFLFLKIISKLSKSRMKMDILIDFLKNMQKLYICINIYESQCVSEIGQIKGHN